MIRELKEEIERLKLGGATGAGGAGYEREMAEKAKAMEAMQKEMEEERIKFEKMLQEQKAKLALKATQDERLHTTP